MTLMTSCLGEYGMEEPEVMQDFGVSRGLGFRVEGTPARQEPAQSRSLRQELTYFQREGI